MNSYSAIALALASALAAPVALAQTCNPNIRRSAPDARYAVNAKQGTVLDKQTGLTWKRCVEGRSGADCGTGWSYSFKWGEALSLAAASTFAGFKDWRIPNSKELESLVEVACWAPAINATAFPVNFGGVWASSPDTSSPDSAWEVGFEIGFALPFYRVSSNAVRLVRGGQ